MVSRSSLAWIPSIRWGFERLAGIALERIGIEARSGALFVFFGKRRTALKILFFDGSGLCLFYKRLDQGTFRVPVAEGDEARLEIEERELDDLLDGIEVIEKPARRARQPKLH